ncbi:hypothetical protein KJ991_00735 [Patescibacteria group bacterium]|nr:hypothetical protein [Patescibacteria group bacterium]MBU4116103.1 hypothetical protein [Patescibacteria group bacterium]
MRDFIKKKKYYKILYLRIILLILIILTIIFAKGAWNVYKKERITNENLINVEKELAGIKEREDFLNTQINTVGTQKGIEKEIRIIYDVVKEGEKMIIIVDKEKDMEKYNTKDETDFWNWIKDIFQ